MKKHTLPALLLALLVALAPMGVSAADTAGLEYSIPVTELTESTDSAYGIEATTALYGDEDLSLDGEAILLLECGTGTMVYAKNPDAQREPASLTKLMTCLLALEHLSLDTEITVTESALADMDPDGSSSGLLAGETYTAEELLYCLMVESANDAALVLAETIGGSQEGFVQMMNDKAEALGCTGTHFANPHGLHDDDHYTTARDIARILMAALEYETFQEIYATSTYTLSSTNQQESRTIYTTDYLIDDNSSYYDSRVVGGKTGFTTPAGRCVACIAQDETRTYLAVVLGASSYDSAGNTVYGSFTTASALFDLGFDRLTVCEALPEWTAVDKAAVTGGAKDATLITGSAATALLPVDYDTSLISVGYQITRELAAPLAEDETVGTVSVLYDGVCVGQVPLVVAAEVPEMSQEKQEILENAANGSSAEEEAAVQEVAEDETDMYRVIGLILMIVLAVIALGAALLLILMLRASLLRRRRRKRRRQARRTDSRR